MPRPCIDPVQLNITIAAIESLHPMYAADRGMTSDGAVDLPGIRQWMETAGYAGALAVEVFSKQNRWTRQPGEILAACAESLQTAC